MRDIRTFTDISWMGAKRFRSINQKFETITYKAVLEQTQPMICVN